MHPNPRQKGSALIVVVAVATGLLILTVATLDATQMQSKFSAAELESFRAKTAAKSGVNEALARIKGTLKTPYSGTGGVPAWKSQGTGCDMFYYTTYNATNSMYRVRSWGRVRTRAVSGAVLAQTTISPDSGGFNYTGWRVHGFEAYIQGRKYIPNAPIYMANGAIEKARGGVDNTASAGFENTPVATWPRVGTGSGAGDSYQGNDLPFRVDARNHPPDFLSAGWGGPAPTVTGPHPYNVFTVQNQVGQEDVKGWFGSWTGAPAGGGAAAVYPDPTNTTYFSNDPTSPNYPYNIDPSVPNVATFSYELWNKYNADAVTGVQIGGTGALSPTLGAGTTTIGNSTTPKVAFATGNLTIPSGSTLRGHGILVIRDNYDPNVGGNNQPGGTSQAGLRVNGGGTLEWTGLVIVAGWAPNVNTQGGGTIRMNGALFGEDRVQSGGEVSASAATIQMYIGTKDGTTAGTNTTTGEKCFSLNYCRTIFEPGGLVYPLMPEVNKEILSFKDL